ncbi:MAG: amidohydrolase [Sporolactobacillus sp.]
MTVHSHVNGNEGQCIRQSGATLLASIGKREVTASIDSIADRMHAASDKIWHYAETRFNTPKSVQIYYDWLHENGFSVQKQAAGISNAFVATAGSGRPVIGILAEYDALEKMSQVAGSARRESEVDGAAGHGCGHNLLGIAALGAALSVKRFIEEHHVTGTVKLFGCPAEESGYGKAYMAKSGLFNTLDVALAWHPSDLSSAWTEKTLAVLQAMFCFKGVASHASSAPSAGRSALDAAEMMNIGVNYLREHVPDQTRIHYAYLDAGGAAANVVPDSAVLHYFMRTPEPTAVQPLFERVCQIAKGAALIADTTVDIKIDSACLNYLPNRALTRVMYENFKQLAPLDFESTDYRYADRYIQMFGSADRERLRQRLKMAFPDRPAAWITEQITCSLNPHLPEMDHGGLAMMSTDVGDVSWIVPTAQVQVACEPQGTMPHAWQWVANGTSSVAHKGMDLAAKIIAMTAVDVLLDPNCVAASHIEHAANLNGRVYRSLIPNGKQPN